MYNGIKQKKYCSGKILSERELASELGISRTPIREAFQQLIKEGIVENEPHRGVKIATMSEDKVIQLYQVREVIEGLGARLMAEKQNNNILEKLSHLLDQAETAIENGDIHLLSEINSQFHYTIALGTENQYLITILQTLQNHISLMMSTSLSSLGRPLENIQEHWMIVHALEKGDARLAEEAMRHHIRNALASAIKQIQTQ
ncbi:GntR family transcriptional regulator [Tepidibacillus infernus]|uniref:GntR family transcriptional regulator n=1 Tax=Tepidibacillus infernus TaxID=1806172 RepID=UPI003B6B4150